MFRVAECRGCRLRYQNPRPVKADLSALYPEGYSPHADTRLADDVLLPRAEKLAYLARHLGYQHLAPPLPGRGWATWLPSSFWRWSSGVGLVPRYVENGRLLEIGCATGQRLRQLRLLGWHDVRGVELVASAADRARSEGFQVDCGPIEDLLPSYPPSSFDTVICSMVLEHLTDPFAALRLIASRLRPGGELLFSTIVNDGLDAALFREFWGGFDFPRHMVYFSKSDLRVALAPLFEGTEFWHQAAPIDFERSARWRVDQGRRFDRMILALASSRFARPLGMGLAWLSLTSRVSIRCRRRQVQEQARFPHLDPLLESSTETPRR